MDDTKEEDHWNDTLTGFGEPVVTYKCEETSDNLAGSLTGLKKNIFMENNRIIRHTVCYDIVLDFKLGDGVTDCHPAFQKVVSGWTRKKLIDGLTPEQCLNRFELAQREDPTRHPLTPAQLNVAKELWAAALKMKVVASKEADAKRERERVVCSYNVEED